MKRRRISWLLSAVLLLGPAAAAAQLLPCASVAPEVRDYVRSRGACRDVKAAPRPRASQSKSGASVVPPPALATPDDPGSTVTPPVSDGSPNGAASVTPVMPAEAADASAPAPATSLAPAADPIPLPPPDAIDPPSARGQFPAAFAAIVALVFGAGVALGLLSGALLVRRWLLRGKPVAGESAPPPTPARHPQPVDQRPAESDAGGLPESGESPEIRFAAWLVPVETTIVLAPRSDAERPRSDVRATTGLEQVRLLAPIEVSGDCIEKALSERTRVDSGFAPVLERLRGAAVQRAAAELNRALDIDILDVLAQGWVQVPAMHDAVQLSAVTRGPPVLVDVDGRHTIASTLRIVLDTRSAGSPLPPLELLLELVADVQGATLAAREGGIDVVALGEATVLARLECGSALIKEHATEISCKPGEPSGCRPPVPERPASVDFPI